MAFIRTESNPMKPLDAANAIEHAAKSQDFSRRRGLPLTVGRLYCCVERGQSLIVLGLSRIPIALRSRHANRD
jgi:hypothetical protein